MTAHDDVLLVEPHDDGVVRVTLNRPDAYNATNEELHHALAQVWDRLSGLENVRALVLTGAGTAFSAGGDFPLMQRMVEDTTLRSAIMKEAAHIVRSLVGSPWPVVAAVNGPAVGLGCSLASMSDLVVMSEEAYFADPHVALGLVAGDGGALTWPLNMGLQRTKEWLLLGGRMSSSQALQFGLANRVVAHDEVLTEAHKLASRLAKLPPQALRESRRVLNQPLMTRMEDALDDVLAAEEKSFDEPVFQAALAAQIAKRRG